MARAFCGDSPQGRIIARISSTGTRIIAAGVSARAKSPGVTVFTRRSVHWADNSTASSRV